MNLSNLGRRLVKELQRGGKKSIVLGLLLLVGVCMWMPMLWRKLSASSDSTPPRATKKSKASSQPAKRQPMPPPASDDSVPQVEWKSLFGRVEGSALIQPVAIEEILRDPFEQEWVRDKSKPAVVTTDVAPADDDPFKKLVLSAVIAGADGGAAIINDVVYRVGQRVPEVGTIQYVLKEIRADRVILQRGDREEVLPLFDLQLPRRESSDSEP